MQNKNVSTVLEHAPLISAPVHPNTFGRLVVDAENRRVYSGLAIDEEKDSADPDHEFIKMQADTYGLLEYHRPINMRYIRERLRDLGPNEAQVLSTYMESAPNFFADVAIKAHQQHRRSGISDLASLGKFSSWRNWLADGASDEQLMNVLQWHVDSLAKQQTDPTVNAAIEENRRNYLTAIERGVGGGWLSEKATAAMERANNIQTYVGDVFDTFIRFKTGVNGYHTRGTDTVVITQGIGRNHKARVGQVKALLEANTLEHEYNHAILGQMTTNSPRPETPGYYWLDEALTEHVALAFKYGYPEVVSPDARPDGSESGIYASERRLLTTLLFSGITYIDPAMATRAYSGSDEEKRAFSDALNKSWGADVLGHLDTQIDVLTSIFAQTEKDPIKVREHVLDKVTTRLQHSPTMVFGDDWVRPESAKAHAESVS